MKEAPVGHTASSQLGCLYPSCDHCGVGQAGGPLWGLLGKVELEEKEALSRPHDARRRPSSRRSAQGPALYIMQATRCRLTSGKSVGSSIQSALSAGASPVLYAGDVLQTHFWKECGFVHSGGGPLSF